VDTREKLVAAEQKAQLACDKADLDYERTGLAWVKADKALEIAQDALDEHDEPNLPAPALPVRTGWPGLWTYWNR